MIHTGEDTNGHTGGGDVGDDGGPRSPAAGVAVAVPLRVKALGIAVLMLLIGGRQWLALLAQCAWVVLWTVVWPFAELVLHCWGAGWLAFLTVEKAQQWLALRRAAPRRQRPIRVQPWEPIPARPDRPAITSNCLDARPVEYRWVDQPDVTA